MAKVVYAKELIKNIKGFKKTILPISEYYVGMEDACEVIIDMIIAGAFEEEEKKGKRNESRSAPGRRGFC